MKKKASWKSTAGLLHIFSILVALFSGVQELISPQASVIITAALTASFTFSNAYVKTTPSLNDDELVKKFEDIASKILKK